jgi:hypothetical protein
LIQSATATPTATPFVGVNENVVDDSGSSAITWHIRNGVIYKVDGAGAKVTPVTP